MHTGWGVVSSPPGVPSTDNPPEDLFKAVKTVWTGRSEKRLLGFLSMVHDQMLFDWSCDYTEYCPGIFLNAQQLHALQTVDRSKFACHEGVLIDPGLFATLLTVSQSTPVNMAMDT